MRLFSALIGALLIAFSAAQTTCTSDNCINRVVNLQTLLGRAFCFTYLAGNAGGGNTVVATVTSLQTVTTSVTRTTTVATPPITQIFRTAATATATANVVAPRQIIANSVSQSVLAACTASALRVSSACICYLNRPRVTLAGL
ncbi:hypothetical protein QBC44DRAFT_374591 [Cladorrhinum sp. PSN332]|nr:hypothetical protein QBC44DRAFT_374591 [Cladorrhinum sp. PSN332]